MKDFVHLHVHSEYSLLDGYATTKAITGRAAELGMDSIALTDHGVLYGAIDFYEAAKKNNVKPIIGVEAYMASGAHTERAGNYFHQLLLARDITGYRNLVRLTTRAHIHGFYKKPRIDRDLLAQHSEGLIATSSCLAGEIPQAILQDQPHKAREIAAWYRDVFGEHFYLELQLHGNTPELPRVNEELCRIGKEMGIPLLATNDTHFVRPEDLETQKMVMAMGFNTTMADLCSKNYVMDNSYHIMSGEEMWERFKEYGTAPLENSRRIADLCNVNLEFGRVQLPAFEIPEGHDASSYLRLICEQGLMRRLNGNPPDHYRERLAFELDVINQTGFPDYMLIVWDYVKYARGRGIPCLPRGSAGASLVLYCLDITEVDPVENKLLFERFLSPERLEMPDIDIDFADSRRHEVLEYIANKYGHDNTAQIITYGTLGAKAALRDVGRVLEVPLPEINRVAGLVPSLPVGTTISQALDRVAELRQIYDQDEKLRRVIDEAQKVEGRMRHVGTHACGLVVSRGRLDDIVPLQLTTSSKDEQAVMASYEGPTLAKIGLLKMDILGLTNLSVVANALEYIAQTTGKRMELSDIPLDDAATFESLSRGETTNVFQFESAGMTRYMRELKPTRVQDLYAMVALYRPGPLEQIPVYIHNKNNPQDITYLHPILKPILEDTYGVIVYQEQIMQLLQAIAGYTLGRAYVVLKAIGKKKRDLMAEEEPKFKAGCRENGLTQEQADKLWDLIQPFAGYSFNRPHSTLYGLLSYQTAYLKVNYTAQYMAAVLDAAAGSTEDVAKAVAECVRLNVQVLPPDVNQSNMGFCFQRLAADENGQSLIAIRFGLSAIKNVGHGPVQSIIAAREQDGPFKSLEDFCARVERQALNKRVVEALIKCGAMDELPGTRHQKLEILDQALSAGSEAQKAREAGQTSLFDLFGESDSAANAAVNVAAIPLPLINETPEQQKERLVWEKELLGMYVTTHPVANALVGVDDSDATPLTEAANHVGEARTYIGLLTGTRMITTRKGDSMLVADLEDIDTTISVVAFPRVYEQHKELLVDDTVLRLTAKADDKRGSLQLVIDQCARLEPTAAAAEVSAASAAVQPEMDIEDVGAHAEEPAVPAAAVPEPTPEPQPAASEPTPEPPAASEPTPEPQPAAPDIPTLTGPVRSIKGRQRASARSESQNGTASASNGAASHDTPHNGNGASTSNGNGMTNHADQGNGGSAPTRDLRLHLPRTADLTADTRRMQDLHELLRAYEGDDQVTLYMQRGNELVVLRPYYTVHASHALLDELADVLGREHVDLVALD